MAYFSRLSALGSVVLLALTAIPVSRTLATTFRDVSLEEMTDAADLVVEATVLSQEAKYDPTGRSLIVTESTLFVQQYIKGKGPSELRLTQVGGTVNGVTETVHGAAHLQVGEPLVVFLGRTSKGADQVVLTGMSLGAYHLRKAPDGRFLALRRRYKNATVWSRRALRPASQGRLPTQIDAEDLIARVRSRAGRKP